MNPKILTTEQFNFLTDAQNNGLEKAKENLSDATTEKLNKTLGTHLPEGEDTKSYISKLAKMECETFRSNLNSTLHHLASEIISKRKAK